MLHVNRPKEQLYDVTLLHDDLVRGKFEEGLSQPFNDRSRVADYINGDGRR